ncbi:L-asparaginase II [Cellulomonas flavigena DSM 20109]|uniref:L-asparaginase II n=1 Tax=Cellulomonas flavigena (strain ATCC 482 / DSM 20109 / BCRC 11376 / JCM 18109 / NBRC 3775 / NCIMB 8073 / NRS 134) TaxID=446466 RepID=D5UL84_CELFN|nr:asparaginase [Cellulomonas flavigena]ADG75966.1 L-asparaginase II [Cellulomonas flavigena DSM 20109]
MSTADVATHAVPLARVHRGDLVESVHLGHVVVLAPGGEVRHALGDPDVVVWPRSSLKPLQALAMLRHGLGLDGPELALVCASHSGEPGHLEVVEGVLAGAGLTAADLRNTPDWPLAPDAAWQRRADGHGPQPLTQNCSGKHAGMLATCVAAGWSTEGYLDPAHPLQRAVVATVAELTGVPVDHVTVDGCGAPLLSTTLTGLARAFGAIAAAAARDDGSATARVGRAMAAHPWHVGGTGRDATAFMTAVPGLVAKDGADGVYAAGLRDGGAVAFKVLDGASRPRPAVLASALALAGVDPAAVAEVGRTPVLGHGRPVGAVRATFGPDA